MTEIRRFLDGAEANDFERWLLSCAANERPASMVAAQMRAGSGLSTISVVTRASTISSLKLTFLAITLSALVGVRVTDSTPMKESATAIAAASDPGPEFLPTSKEESADILTDTATGESTLQAADVPASRAPVATVAKNAKSGRTTEQVTAGGGTRIANGSDLRQEIRLLDLARNAVKRHQPEEALVALKSYATHFSAGAFKQEAALLRMQALEQLGEIRHASSIARQFVENNPNSPYVQRAARIAKSSATSNPP